MAATTETNIGTMIVRTSGTCGGSPRIEGTRITVRNIAFWFLRGEDAEDILGHYSHLTLPQIYAAITYYLANREAMDMEFAAEEKVEAELEARYRAEKSAEKRSVS